MSTLTQFIHHKQISYVHPNVFVLNSFQSNTANNVHTINVSLNESQSIVTHPHAPLAFPMFQTVLSAPAATLSTNLNSTIMTDPTCNYHTRLQVHSIDESILPRSLYHTIPTNSKVTLQIEEILVNNEVQLMLTNLYLHKESKLNNLH